MQLYTGTMAGDPDRDGDICLCAKDEKSKKHQQQSRSNGKPKNGQQDFNTDRFVRSPIIAYCSQYFVSHLSSFTPALEADMMESLVLNATVSHCLEAQSALLALCSCVLAHTMAVPAPRVFDAMGIPCRSTLDLSKMLLRRARELIEGCRRSQDIRHRTIFLATIHWAACAYAWLGQYDEVLDVVHAAKVANLYQRSSRGSELCHRLFEMGASERALHWLLVVRERLCALQRLQRPTLGKMPRSLELGRDFRTNWLVYMAALVSALDGILLEPNLEDMPVPTETFSMSQHIIAEALPEPIPCSRDQVVDLKCCQGWLQSTIWKQAVKQGDSGIDSQTSTDAVLPLRVVRDIVHVLWRYDFQNEIENVPQLYGRLCDIATIAFQAISVDEIASRTNEEVMEYVIELTRLITFSDAGRQHCVPRILQTMKALRLYSSPTDPQHCAGNDHRKRLCDLVRERCHSLVALTALSPSAIYYGTDLKPARSVRKW